MGDEERKRGRGHCGFRTTLAMGLWNSQSTAEARIYLSFFWSLLFIFLAHSAWADAPSFADRLVGDRNAKWQITADKMSYDRDEGLYRAEGNVVITRGGQVLKASEARYNEKTGMVEAAGDVVLETN